MDDRTPPSARVRHNLQGLAEVLPPAYLLSYVMSHDDEPLHDATDLPMLTRSRMPGVLGLSYFGRDLSEADEIQLSHEVGIYKAHRDITAQASAVLLTAQTSEGGRPGWEVMEHVTPGGDALMFAFDNGGDEGS